MYKSLVLFFLLWFSINQSSFAQFNLPEIHSIQRVTPKEGLKDRKVDQVFRLKSGMYLFVTDKFQFYSGRKFIGEPLPLPQIHSIIGEYYLSEDFEIYDLNHFEKIAAEIPAGKVIDVQTESNAFLFLIETEKEYQLHRWENGQWEFVNSYALSLEIEKFTFLKDEFYFIDANRNLRKHSNLKTYFNGDELLEHDHPADYQLSNINNHLFFSFEDRKGIFRMDVENRIDTLTLESIIHLIKKDEAGNALLIGRRQVVTKNFISLIREDGHFYSWNELLEVSDIIEDVASRNFLEEITLCGLNGVDILRFSVKRKFAKAYAQKEEDKRGFGNLIMGVRQDSKGRLLLIKENRELFLKEEDQVKLLSLDGDEMVGYCHSVIYNEPEDDYYISTYDANRNGFIYKINLDDKSVRLIQQPKGIFTAFKSKTGEIYHAGFESSVYRMDGDSLEFFDFSKELSNRNIRSLYVGGHILLGTPEGLFKVDELKANAGITRVETLERNDEIRSIDFHNSKYYIGTHGSGLYILDENLTMIRKIDQDCCSINEYVYTSTVDDHGRIWVATNEGLFVLDEDGNLLDHLNTRDGISAQEFNTRASTKLANGQFAFGTVNGITIIDPANFKPSESKDFYVEDVLAYVGPDVFVGTENENVFTFYTKPDSIKIKMQQYGFDEFQYSFEAKNKLNYEGESELVLSNNEITMLDPSLTLHELYVNGSDKTALNIRLKRNLPLILRNLLLYVGVLLALGFIFFKIQDRRNKRKLKESENQRQLAVIKLEALRSQLNPHFIFNSLGAISYFMQTNENKLANSYLTKFAKLIRAFLESSKNEYISLKDEVNLLKYYLTLEQMRFDDSFSYSIDVDPEINLDHEQIPTMLIQPFVENSLIHGLNNRQDKNGEIKLAFNKKGKDLLCTIEDNGVGRVKAEEIKRNSIKRHKSRGTQIINERILASKEIDGQGISVEYLDKYDGEEASGTLVSIYITN